MPWLETGQMYTTSIFWWGKPVCVGLTVALSLSSQPTLFTQSALRPPVDKRGHWTVTSGQKQVVVLGIWPGETSKRMTSFRAALFRSTKRKFQSDFCKLLSFRLNMAVNPLPSLVPSCWFWSWAQWSPFKGRLRKWASGDLLQICQEKALFWSLLQIGLLQKHLFWGVGWEVSLALWGYKPQLYYVLPGQHTATLSFSNTNTQWGLNLNL